MTAGGLAGSILIGEKDAFRGKIEQLKEEMVRREVWPVIIRLSQAWDMSMRRILRANFEPHSTL